MILVSPGNHKELNAELAALSCRRKRSGNLPCAYIKPEKKIRNRKSKSINREGPGNASIQNAVIIPRISGSVS